MASAATRWIGLACLALGLAMIIVDTSIVNVAVPRIITDLKITPSTAEWVNSSYALVFAAALITLSRIGDIARSDFVVSLPLVYKGTHYAHPKVTVSQGADVFAAPAGGPNARAVEIEADGEIVGRLPARFSVRPAAVTLLA